MSVPIVGFWTDFVLDKCNDAWLRTTSFTPPATLYAALSTAKARRIFTIAELASAGSYARVALSSTNFSASVNGYTHNTADIVFPTPTADWATVYSVVLYDAATAGNALMIAGFTAADASYLTRLTGQTLTIPAGAIQINRS